VIVRERTGRLEIPSSRRRYCLFLLHTMSLVAQSLKEEYELFAIYVKECYQK